MPQGDLETRERIALAALEEFAEFGFHGGRTDRIAKRADANKQLLYYYFGSKAKLYDAVLREAARHLVTAEGGRGTSHPIEHVRLRLRSVLESLVAHPTETRLLIRGIHESGEQGVAARDAVEELVGQIAARISKGQGLGYVRDDVDPTRAAEHAVVLLLGHLSLAPVLATGSPDPGRTGWIQAAHDALLETLAW